MYCVLVQSMKNPPATDTQWWVHKSGRTPSCSAGGGTFHFPLPWTMLKQCGTMLRSTLAKFWNSSVYHVIGTERERERATFLAAPIHELYFIKFILSRCWCTNVEIYCVCEKWYEWIQLIHMQLPAYKSAWMWWSISIILESRQRFMESSNVRWNEEEMSIFCYKTERFSCICASAHNRELVSNKMEIAKMAWLWRFLPYLPVEIEQEMFSPRFIVLHWNPCTFQCWHLIFSSFFRSYSIVTIRIISWFMNWPFKLHL